MMNMFHNCRVLINYQKYQKQLKML